MTSLSCLKISQKIVDTWHPPERQRERAAEKGVSMAAVGQADEGLFDVGSEEGDELEGEDDAEEQVEGDVDGEDLCVELDEAQAGGAVEAAPGVEEGEHAGAADDGGGDLAAEGAVEGDDALGLLGQHRGLAAGEGDLGGQDDGDVDEQGDGEDEEELPQRRQRARVARLVRVRQAQRREHGQRRQEGNLRRQRIDGRRRPDVAPRPERRDAAVPHRADGVGDDNVRPGHVPAGEDDGRRDPADDGREEGGQEEREQVEQDLEDDAVGDCGAQRRRDAAPAGSEAADAVNVADGAADGRGDGAFLDVDDLWVRAAQVGAGVVVFVGVLAGGRKRDKVCRGRLDLCQRCNDAHECVADLETVSSLDCFLPVAGLSVRR